MENDNSENSSPDFAEDYRKEETKKKVDRKVLKYVFFAAVVLAVIGFFLTYEGYKPKPPQDDNILPPEQMESIKEAAEDEENLKILGLDMQEKETFDPSKLSIQDLEVGGGEEVESGDTVRVHYTGWFLDGTKFDSSKDRGQPFSFKVGAGYVIKGWDQGILGMKVGGKRKLIIPPYLAYGAGGIPGAIPPNSALIFEIELLEITN